jgi:hypothetical protein
MHEQRTPVPENVIRLCQLMGPDYLGRTWLRTPEGTTHIVKLGRNRKMPSEPMSAMRKLKLQRTAMILVCLMAFGGLIVERLVW